MTILEVIYRNEQMITKSNATENDNLRHLDKWKRSN